MEPILNPFSENTGDYPFIVNCRSSRSLLSASVSARDDFKSKLQLQVELFQEIMSSNAN